MSDSSNNQASHSSVSGLDSLKLSLTQLEELTGLRRQSLSSILTASEVPCTPGPRGSKLYSLKDVIQTLVQMDKGGGNAEQVDDKLKAVKLELLELELQQEKGVLVDREEVLLTVSDHYQTIREQFVVLGQTLARDLALQSDAATCARIIDEKVNEILGFLSTEAFQSPNHTEESDAVPE